MIKQVRAILQFNRQQRKLNLFPYNGIRLYTGTQGSGKTLSAVLYVLDIVRAFPDAHIVTNLKLSREHFGGFHVYPFKGIQSFNHYNGTNGTIFLLDEIHLYFNSLESKGIDLSVFDVISQQRKNRVHIVGTSQLFSRVAKPFREQCREVVFCESGYFRTFNDIVAYDDIKEKDGLIYYDRSKLVKYWRTPDLFDLYDTYQVIKRPN